MAASYPSSVKSFGTKTDGSTVIMAAHVNDLQLEVSAIETDLLGSWVDYSATSTITGWSSYVIKQIWYKKILPKLYLVTFQIEGTSNSTSLNFTLPFTADAVGNQGCAVSAINNGGQVSNGYIVIAPASDTLNAYTTLNDAGWTGAGTKEIIGQIIIATTT